uniref:ABC transporter domain-containing protein n=1 Tax=Lactuca sativa TaxID=4236 RepID=A0A9R1UES5_LACSA|nr:hypothetical protein LSAT_V11C900475060 [Lactuca sativa]
MVSGYCEQNDIHSPNVTVYESLLYSAWLRLSSDVNTRTQKIFVDELMELVELKPLKDALVGLPGLDGLTIEQQKWLTIVVELVASPSIIFIDEPTSGLDARAAAIVRRTVRNTIDIGRTFDEDWRTNYICRTFRPPISQACGIFSRVPRIRNGYNHVTWVLEVTSSLVENQHNLDYAQIYANSTCYQYDLNVDLLDVHADKSRFLEELTKQVLSSDLDASKY